jgi:hypothetical protein
MTLVVKGLWFSEVYLIVYRSDMTCINELSYSVFIDEDGEGLSLRRYTTS